ncbi:TRF2-interacting telomeric protein/Rap1 C terminal domain-containing protein [Talaromyces proteolyticus]|uniref:DNA-binding protein RAP1 n=1 Tax=Talaromyces proteolyticus TaxID=1131652 RepID=A0AAD4L5M6_9EURO|nr:TRF2-interacting telomeric protein/Rap1 C terminal domain-containing protein [Talaromyces proteolyticus]KAH8705035.1 TRF2-interacting telomeric protein/Rap1 C terminal domain-containing protein [Talaromyces proteolyticus]
MAATVIYKTANSDGHTGTLFQGRSFWLSLNVPQRDRFKELIKANGGVVVLQEKDADIKLVDHNKREIPLNTYSYKFVEKSIQNGQLEDLEAHRAGKTTRPVGAYDIPSRGHRIAYNLQDDQILWDWMQPYEDRGEQIAGNVIYQRLAEMYPRHTFQSWRDRYLKKIRGKPRPGGPRQVDQQEGTISQAACTEATTVQSDPIPHIPETSVRRSASSRVSKTVSDPNIPEETQDYVTAEVRRPQARSNMNVIKRKRLSDEGIPAVPKFDMNDAAKRRRRATDFIPRADPSTLHQSHDSDARTDEHQQNPSSKETDQVRFEREPQFSSRSTRLNSQSQPISASQKAEYENLEALAGLPKIGAYKEDAEDKENEDNDKDDDAEAVNDWIEERMRAGQKGEDIVLALDYTSMNAELADRVLASLSRGDGIPKNVRGVWTEEEDEILQGTETRKIDALEKKHGSEYFWERYDYLENRRKAYQEVMKEG